MYYGNFGNTHCFKFYQKQKTREANQEVFQSSPLFEEERVLLSEFRGNKLKVLDKWQGEIKPARWFRKTHWATVSATHLCYVDGVPWNFWEDQNQQRNQSKQIPLILIHFQMQLAFCQDGMEKQKMSWRINNDYSLLLSYPQITDKTEGSIGIFTFETPPQGA